MWRISCYESTSVADLVSNLTFQPCGVYRAHRNRYTKKRPVTRTTVSVKLVNIDEIHTHNKASDENGRLPTTVVPFLPRRPSLFGRRCGAPAFREHPGPTFSGTHGSRVLSHLRYPSPNVRGRKKYTSREVRKKFFNARDGRIVLVGTRRACDTLPVPS